MNQLMSSLVKRHILLGLHLSLFIYDTLNIVSNFLNLKLGTRQLSYVEDRQIPSYHMVSPLLAKERNSADECRGNFPPESVYCRDISVGGLLVIFSGGIFRFGLGSNIGACVVNMEDLK